MRKCGIYISGGVEEAIAFFMVRTPKMTACQVHLCDPMRFYPPSRYMEDEVAEAVALFQQTNGIEIVVHAPYVISILRHLDKSVECVKRYLAICYKCNIKNLVVHSGSWPEGTDPVASWVDFLQYKVRPQDFNTTVCLENMPYLDGKAMSGRQLSQVCEQVIWPPGDAAMRNVGICLDTVHAWVGDTDLSGLNPEHVEVLHLNQTKDGLGSGHDRHCDNHLNEGVIPTEALKSFLRTYPKATVISEFDHDSPEERKKEIALAREMVGSSQ